MKPADNIENLIKNLRYSARKEVKEQIFQEALAALEETNEKPTAVKPLPVWRIVMKSSVAKFSSVAAVIIMTIMGLLYIELNENSVNAAEILEETIKVNENYKGWIHISEIYNKFKDGTDEIEHSTTGTRHINTIDGTWIWEDKTGSSLKIYYFSPTEDEYIEYDSLKGEVALNDLNSFPAKKLVDSYPLTANARIISFKKATGRDPYNITITQEGDYDRFDILFFENMEEEIQISKEKNTGFASNITLWVDRKTHIIYKSFTEIRYKKLNGIVPGMEVYENFEYGEPLINNIYDLVVPKDAVVIDNRKTLEVENVLERVKSRIADFTHYIALMTQTEINDDGTLKDSCTLYLFAQDGDTWLVNRYPVGPTSYPNKPKIVIPSIKETPEKLLSLDIITVLDKIKHAHLWGYFVFDGENFYSNEASPHFPEGIDKAQKKQTYDSIQADMGLFRNIWFGQKEYGYETKLKLIKREDNIGEIGLHIEYYSYPPPYKARHEKYYWFDPQRDDMPVERLYRRYLEDGQTVEYEIETMYLDYSQFPDGRWYPARWSTITTNYNKENGYKNTQEYQLTIYTNIKLEEDWFTYPNTKTVVN